MNTFIAGWKIQIQNMKNTPDWYLPLITCPFQVVIFVTIIQSAGRQDINHYGILAPALMALWSLSLQSSGELISFERENGSLDGLIASPKSIEIMFFGRLCAVTSISFLAFFECYLVGSLMIGSYIKIQHIDIFIITALATVAAMTTWAGVMSSLFVLARSVRIFQNSLSYPFYLLGGVLVPVSLMPEWIHPISKLIFLSWSSDLLREAINNSSPITDFASRISIIILFTILGALVSRLFLIKSINQVRKTGSFLYT